MASDIKERIAPASQAYYKLHDIRLVHFGLLHKKPTEAHIHSVLVTTGILRPQDSPPLNGDWIEGIERVCEWRRDFAATPHWRHAVSSSRRHHDASRSRGVLRTSLDPALSVAYNAGAWQHALPTTSTHTPSPHGTSLQKKPP